jgi:hypothetical protein
MSGINLLMRNFISALSLVVLASLAASAQRPTATPSTPPAAKPATPHQRKPVPPLTWTPNHYAAHHIKHPITIDGNIDKKVWRKAEWTEDFIDIEGDSKPKPKFRTRTKMLWDGNYLYIAAEISELDVKATITKRDSVIFKDNDFEVFVKPLADQLGYFEFEMNALNTGWDLYLNKPYRMQGHADNSWDIDGLKTAVKIQGTLNKSDDTDKGWTVEIAYPWRGFLTRQPVPQPVVGTEWRINFSRVEWTAGQLHEDNWVWSHQGVIDMHVPDRWGYLTFAK